MRTSINEWEELYKNIPATMLPWESRAPSPTLVRFVRDGVIRERVLDVGCGSGTHGVWMAGKGLDVTGVDVSETAVALSRTLSEARNLSVDLYVADAAKLPFSDQTFDAIFDRGTYHHQDEGKRRYADELTRVLKDGGAYLLLAFHPSMRWPKSVGLTEIEERFGSRFSLEWIGEELHVQPDGRNVRLLAVLMRKHV